MGETLTADTSGITDADGLSNATFTYQWLSSRDTEIDGATTSTYTLVETDEGKAIKVQVSFTDDADNQEMLTSAPTAAVAAPAQADSEDEPSELSYLTVVVTEDDSDPDNVFTTFTITWNDAEDCSASYNAYLDGVVGDPIHLGSAASEGEQIAASLTNVSAESIGFDAKLYCGTIGSGRLVDSLWIPEYSRSFDTIPISRAYLPKPGTYSTEPGLTALTVSSGTLTPAFHSQTLNYTVPDVANADGRITLTTTTKADYYTVAFIPGSLYFYISSCSHGGQQTSVSYQDDTGNPLYPLTDADANTPGFQMELDEGENVFAIHVKPNCENGHVYKLTVTRAANASANTPATGAPTISGAAQVGETLTASTSGIADANGLTGATFSYQWLGSRDAEIQGATGATYTLVTADEGKAIKVRVSFTDDAGNEEALTSEPTDAVAAAPPPPPDNVRAVTQKSSAVKLTWDAPDDATVTGYRIDRRSAANPSDQQRSAGGPRDHHTLVEDTGSADTGYTDKSAEKGVEYEYQVSARNEAGPGEGSDWVRAGAAQAQNTPATGGPVISGAAQVGETLTADTSGIADENGLDNAAFAYQWLGDDTDIDGATGSTYALVAADVGRAIRVRVSFTDDAGNEETLTSEATAAAAATATELPAQPTGLSALVFHDHVDLTWDDPDDNSITGYEILRRDKDVHQEGTFETVEADTGSQATTYTDTSVYPEKRYVYRIKALNAGRQERDLQLGAGLHPGGPLRRRHPERAEPGRAGAEPVLRRRQERSYTASADTVFLRDHGDRDHRARRRDDRDSPRGRGRHRGRAPGGAGRGRERHHGDRHGGGRPDQLWPTPSP